MSIATALLKVRKPSSASSVPLTRAERLKVLIVECDEQPVRAFNRRYTCSMTRVTEINHGHEKLVVEYKLELEDELKKLLSMTTSLSTCSV